MRFATGMSSKSLTIGKNQNTELSYYLRRLFDLSMDSATYCAESKICFHRDDVFEFQLETVWLARA